MSKDSHFQQRSFVFGHPPKVIWLRIGNCTTAQVESLLRVHSATLYTFEADGLQSIPAGEAPRLIQPINWRAKGTSWAFPELIAVGQGFYAPPAPSPLF